MNWRYRHTVLSLCLVAFFGTMVARLVISPMVPLLTDAFGVSNGAIGLALTGMWACYALVQFPSGVLADRYGERPIILLALALTGVASLALVAATSYPLFVIFTVALGAGAGLHYSVGTTLVTRLFTRTGRAIGIHVTGGPLAGLLTPVAVAYVAARYGFRAAFVLGAAVAFVVLLLFGWRVRPTPPARPDVRMRSRFEPASIVELLSRPEIAFTTLLASLATFTWQATSSFLPAFLVASRGMSVELASALFSVYFVVLGVVQPATGWLSDRVGRDATTALTMATGIVGYGLLAGTDSLAGAAVAVPLVGFAMSWGGPLQSRFMDHLADEERASGFGLVRTVYMGIGALGSGVVGTLADAAGWTVAFFLLAGLMAVGLVAILIARYV